MALSRSARIWTLLVIDSVFLLIELIVGYAVGSLALVADSFHMLNDVLSLIVALYAIKVSGNSPNSKYSYGWHRAEILAALVNGVFLLALCLSIFLEAIERFFSVPEISNPKLVVIVGSLGLASNILGLFLFHEHGHSHDHGHGDETSASEAPKGVDGVQSGTQYEQTETVPLLRPPSAYDPSSVHYGHPAQTRARVVHTAEQAGYNRNTTSSSFRDRSWSNSIHEILKSPISARSMPEDAVIIDVEDGGSDEDCSPITPLEPVQHCSPSANANHHEHNHSRQNSAAHTHQHHSHDEHNHSHNHNSDPEAALAKGGYGNLASHGHGHSHGSMNMHALLLHVLGDALGNVGVIASGLIIWLSDWKWKYLSDPTISLVITVIIFTSALPLVKSASYILLQGVPPSIALEELHEDIRRVRGVTSVHDLHVWQLSEQKIIASVHVCVARNVEYMSIATDIREVLHDYNIHSCTIQPEYEPVDHEGKPKLPSLNGENQCLLACPRGTCAPHSIYCPSPPHSSSAPDSH